MGLSERVTSFMFIATGALIIALLTVTGNGYIIQAGGDALFKGSIQDATFRYWLFVIVFEAAFAVIGTLAIWGTHANGAESLEAD